ncbi:tyrosine-type recombinase/integrase [Desulfurispora thermophila]|uniref:tyrosine-type recombinase/integrase n=1 Tax=Desulfurispora thermophila TaxID=265470 RepID=UPI00037BE9B1|nr:tyrosine-type recombinase/integrase [Desulfurispora thermophila]
MAKNGKNGTYKNLEDQFKKAFRQAKKASDGMVSVKSIYRYQESMKNFMAFCAEQFYLQKLAKIQEKHLRAYIEHRRAEGTAEKTIKNDIAAIRFFHRYMDAKYKLPDNKALGLMSTPNGGKDRSWTDREYHKMLKLARTAGREDVVCAMRLARYAGLRLHEITRLSRRDAERAIERGEMTVKGKGGKVRDVLLSPRAAQALKDACRLLPEEEKLFVRKGEKTHLVNQRIQGFIRRHRNKVAESGRGVRLTMHGLRHTYARELYFAQVRRWVIKGRRKYDRRAMYEVSRQLGHGRWEVTRIYLGG